MTINTFIEISAAAEKLGVSEASIRNWIKVGYLENNKDKGITEKSFQYFFNNVAGKEKLTKRANKSLSDYHNHSTLVSETLNNLKIKSNIVAAAADYENGLSKSYRNKEGVYYTPEKICNVMFSDIPAPKSNETFCDPCCGSGNFIIAAIKHGYSPENIFGFDFDPVAVELTKQRIYSETRYKSENIICADFLKSDNFIKFDVILTNPPWGKKLSKDERRKLGQFFESGKSLDSCSLFLFGCLKSLNTGGYISLLMPDSFFKIAIFEDSRKRLLNYKVKSFRDFGKPFKGLLAKAQSFCAVKLEQQDRDVQCYTKEGTHKRKQISFLTNPNAIINFESTADDAYVISKLYSKPYITLSKNAKWGLGIVTGNNNKFCKDTPSTNSIPVIKGTDIKKGFLNEPTTFISNDFSQYQQVAPIELFKAKEKILYRFISSKLVFYHDTEQLYPLNSVNMIIPINDLPITTKNIVELFNTDLFSWVFEKIFNTHKVLKADLEKMPIPVDFLKNKVSFTEEDLLGYYGITKEKNGTFRA